MCLLACNFIGFSTEGGAYHSLQNFEASFRTADAIYFASPSLVYTVVPSEEPNEIGFSEIG